MAESSRTLLALVLSFAVLIGWTLLTAPPPPQPLMGPPSPLPDSAQASPVPAAVAPVIAGAAEAPLEALGTAVGGGTARDLRVRTDLYEAVFSTAGAVIERWTLPQYRARAPRPGETSEPVEVISATSVADGLRPLSVITGVGEIDVRLASAVFAVEGSDLRLAPGEKATLVFRWADGKGSSIEKTLAFDGSSYSVEVGVRCTLSGGRASYLLLGPGFADEADPPRVGGYVGRAVVQVGSKVSRRDTSSVSVKKLTAATGGQWPTLQPSWLETLDSAGEVVRHRGVEWAGLESNYFAVIAYAPVAMPEVLVFAVPREAAHPPQLGQAISLTSGAGKYSLYIGPKDPDVLGAARPDLASAVDFGFFATFANVLLSALRFCYRGVHNYGIAIILLTIAVKIVLLPLTIKQLDMMQKMSKLRPQLKVIEDKYARARNDPKERLEANRQKNAEVMALYSREGVNPAGGCLPLLLQFPVLYGFYGVLGTAIELRHAPFLLWVQDLSAKDPYYVTPILMMITMVVQQAITPSTMDAMQRRMMFAMPVVFGWIFKDLSSGLVLYWLTQNVLTIGQQVWMNRMALRRDELDKETRRQSKKKRGVTGVEAR